MPTDGEQQNELANVSVRTSDRDRLARIRKQEGRLGYAIISDALDLYESREVSSGNGMQGQAAAANPPASSPDS